MFKQNDLSFLYKYFIAEKQGSLFFLIVGMAAVTLAVVFWLFNKSNPPFFKGIAFPLVAIGLIQIVVGYTVYSRTDKQKAAIAYYMGMDRTHYIKQTELPRMKTVMKNFVIYRWLEIAFIITGIILVVRFRLPADKAFWYGFGVALVIQSIILLGADHMAEKRGKIYTGELEQIIASE